MNLLPFQVESELDVKYTVLHPQLCGQGGNAILADVLKGAEPDTHFVVGACAPEAQMKLFKKVIRNAGFDERYFIPVDIRGTSNDGILECLREAVDKILNGGQQAAAQ